MKIVHCVESYYPSTGGMQEAVRQISERLVRAGHAVTVVTRAMPERDFSLLDGVAIKEFSIRGNPAVAETEHERAYVEFLKKSDADIITFFAAQQWATDLALPVLKHIRAKKVSVPTGYSGLYRPEYAAYYQRMRSYIHDYDLNIYLGHDYRDIRFAKECGVSKIEVIPNGASEEEFLGPVRFNVRKELKVPDDHFLILHVGSYTGRKGHREAADIFFRLPREIKATLLMIGNDNGFFWRQYVKHPGLFLRRIAGRISGRRRVVFSSFSRQFTVDAYRDSDVFLFPSQIECSPIVLFECAASSLVFVASDAGNAAEIAQWTGGGIIIPTSKDAAGFSHADVKAGARILAEICEHHERRNAMGLRAFAAWKEKFTWRSVAARYEQAYKKLLA